MHLPSSSRALLLLCLCCACWAFGFGLECPLCSRWLQDAARSDTFIGFNTGMHFLGVIIMGLFGPVLMRRYGRGCIVAGLIICGAGEALFPFANAAGYFVLRLLSGAGSALAMIALETLINLNAPLERRARDFALYACSVGIGFALGSFIGLHVFEHSPRLAFVLGGGVTIAAVPFVLFLPAFPPIEPDAKRPPLKPPLLCVGSAWCQGFLEAGMLALLPLYLRTLGMTDGTAGNLIGGILVGVLFCQIPIGWLADHLGRERILIGCFLIVAVGLTAVPYADRDVGLPVWLFLIGVCSGAFYPLGLAILGERIPVSDIPRANAWFMAVNSFGSLVSPLVSGPVMEHYGDHAMFWTGEAAILVVLILWVLSKRGRRNRLFHFQASRAA